MKDTIFHTVSFLFSMVTIFFLLFLSIQYLLPAKPRPKNPPPSPPALPIVGHLHLLSLPIHRVLACISDRYGPVILLRLGVRRVLLVSSLDAAEECLTKNDILFANRPFSERGKHLSYNYTTLSASSYGPHWRNLRRIASHEAFSSSRVRVLSPSFAEEVLAIVGELYGDGSGGFLEVDMRSTLSTMAFNMMMRMITGERYYKRGKPMELTDEGRRFWHIIFEGAFLNNATGPEAGPEDSIPLLRWFGVGRAHKKRLVKLEREIDELMKELIEKGQRGRADAVGGKDDDKRSLVDGMLTRQEKEGDSCSELLVKGIIMTTLMSSVHNLSRSMEWVMSFVLNHPKVLEKARAEIEARVGHDRVVSDSDLPNLRYFNNVIKETFRLAPPGPLLVPHESSEECNIGGFTVPRGTVLFVNVHKIFRDPNLWEDPLKFDPARFDGYEEGNWSRFFPFGIGRRSCPGEALTWRTMGLGLGALVQCFEWERVGGEEVDMSEGAGFTLERAIPLEAMCKPRGVMTEALSRQLHA